ncbi:MAG: hypothetical protein EOM25_14795, partial [Deltaproteobacteria bacterium]|nr:hypothetical protein [Deltaproteobacteria bacterium]
MKNTDIPFPRQGGKGFFFALLRPQPFRAGRCSMEWSGAWTGLKTLLVAMAILAVMAGWAWAGHGKSKTAEAKTGIVLVAFGSTVAEARVAYAEIEKAVAAACPGLERVWAYSSDQVRTKLAKEGIAVPSPAEALARLAARGFDRAVVLPLMVIPGEEFHALA